MESLVRFHLSFTMIGNFFHFQLPRLVLFLGCKHISMTSFLSLLAGKSHTVQAGKCSLTTYEDPPKNCTTVHNSLQLWGVILFLFLIENYYVDV